MIFSDRGLHACYVDAEIVQPLEKAQITNSTMASDKKMKKKVTLLACV